MPLSLLLGDLDPRECKLHCAVFNGTEHPADVLARSWDEWLGWNSYRPDQDVFNRQFIFSLAQSRAEPWVWLFGGVFEVVGRRPDPHDFSYDVELREEFLPGCIKRLKVRFRPPGRQRRPTMERYIDQIEVAEILREPYSGEPFPGPDSINITLAELEVIYSQERPDWRGALQYVKGVYVINDRASGKTYVGSAYGDTGVWARWGQYVQSRHGGNVDLRALVKRKGDAYARSNLAFSLLQSWPMATPDSVILAREGFWKDVLLSRQFGHNRN
jgi:hypothetical protein